MSFVYAKIRQKLYITRQIYEKILRFGGLWLIFHKKTSAWFHLVDNSWR